MHRDCGAGGSLAKTVWTWWAGASALMCDLLRMAAMRWTLLAILCACLVLIGLDVHTRLALQAGEGVSPLWLTSRDFSMGENLEFIMLCWGALMLMRLGSREGAYGLIWMALILFYLAIDNRAQLHEIAGQWLAPYISGETLAEREQLGEVLYLMLPVTCAALGIAYYYARLDRRQASMVHLLVLTIAVIAVFAIGLDSVHAAFPLGDWRENVLGAIEDGAELVGFAILGWLGVAMERFGRKSGSETAKIAA